MPAKKPRIRKPNKKRKQKAEVKRPSRPGWIRIEDAEAFTKDSVEKALAERRAFGPMTTSPDAQLRANIAQVHREHQNTRDERDGLLAMIAITQRTGSFHRIADKKGAE